MQTGGLHDRILKFPYRGAPQTVGTMRDAALKSQNDYVVRQLAEHVCGGLPSKDYLSEYLAIYHFVLSHTRYMRDPRTVELVRSPDVIAKTLLAGRTPSLDCDDMACLICAMVLSVGGQCQLATVAFRKAYYQGKLQYSHVYAMAKEPQASTWVILDPVAADRAANMRSRTKAVKFWPIA